MSNRAPRPRRHWTEEGWTDGRGMFHSIHPPYLPEINVITRGDDLYLHKCGPVHWSGGKGVYLKRWGLKCGPSS